MKAAFSLCVHRVFATWGGNNSISWLVLLLVPTKGPAAQQWEKGAAPPHPLAAQATAGSTQRHGNCGDVQPGHVTFVVTNDFNTTLGLI